VRLFVAIPIPDHTTRELAVAVERMKKRPGAEELRWSPPESWHITLQFLGNTRAEEYACLVERLGAIRIHPVKIVPDKVGAFGRVGILYAGVKVTPELMGLQKQVIASTKHCGFAPEDRPYRPHMTLARRRGRGGRNGITTAAEKNRELMPFTEFAAHEFALYESFLGGAARYEIRERFSLG
jgi:RNA 2',3'-cyclic 3'-phosphodiesterase